MRPSSVALGFLMIAATACGGSGATGSDGTWVGTITTEGNVTTVVNESGSVWGGAARLVEEASIGVEAGPKEYMLGGTGGLYATASEIYLVDASASKVRVYDYQGTHLRSFGREGQGPGELQYPYFIVVGSAGRVYVTNSGNQRVTIFSADGELVDEIPLSSKATCCVIPLAIRADGGAWIEALEADPVSGARRRGVLLHTAEGPTGDVRLFPEIDYDRRVMRMGGREVEGVPFAAYRSLSLSADGRLIVGANDRYQFRLIAADGATTVIERFWDPVPVSAEEAAWRRRYTLAEYAQLTEQYGPRYRLEWDGNNIPPHKPAYLAFVPTASGGVWLVREGPGDMEACDLSPEVALTVDYLARRQCSRPSLIIDAFDRDGRYLGEVTGLQMWLRDNTFVRGDTVLNVEQDEAGTIMVKRYRLVLPGEE